MDELQFTLARLKLPKLSWREPKGGPVYPVITVGFEVGRLSSVIMERLAQHAAAETPVDVVIRFRQASLLEQEEPVETVSGVPER